VLVLESLARGAGHLRVKGQDVSNEVGSLNSRLGHAGRGIRPGKRLG
jgi:hypothetical protein